VRIGDHKLQVRWLVTIQKKSVAKAILLDRPCTVCNRALESKMPPQHFSFGPDIGYTVGNMLVAQLGSGGKDGACAVPHYRCRDTSLMVVAPSREDALNDLTTACDEIVRLLTGLLCDDKKMSV
jgi:hypothetical protein